MQLVHQSNLNSGYIIAKVAVLKTKSSTKVYTRINYRIAKICSTNDINETNVEVFVPVGVVLLNYGIVVHAAVVVVINKVRFQDADGWPGGAYYVYVNSLVGRFPE